MCLRVVVNSRATTTSKEASNFFFCRSLSLRVRMERKEKLSRELSFSEVRNTGTVDWQSVFNSCLPSSPTSIRHFPPLRSDGNELIQLPLFFRSLPSISLRSLSPSLQQARMHAAPSSEKGGEFSSSKLLLRNGGEWNKCRQPKGMDGKRTRKGEGRRGWRVRLIPSCLVEPLGAYIPVKRRRRREREERGTEKSAPFFSFFVSSFHILGLPQFQQKRRHNRASWLSHFPTRNSDFSVFSLIPFSPFSTAKNADGALLRKKCREYKPGGGPLPPSPKHVDSAAS